HQADHLVHRHCLYRRLRHRRHRLCGAESDQGMARAPKDLGVVLSASNFGVLFGSQIFGWIGDRYGRKTALILANFLFGVLTFAAAYSTNLTELSWLRFLAGLGIGGVIPNVVAINAESAPRNRRATLAIIATGMVPIGGALAGFASAALVPTYG